MSDEAKEFTFPLNYVGEVSVNLLPCPFCGGSAYMSHRGNQHCKKQSILFGCKPCRIEITNSILSGRSTIEWIIEKSVEQWNTRAALDGKVGDSTEIVAKFMVDHGFSTGHGDDIRDLLGELSWQIFELRNAK